MQLYRYKWYDIDRGTQNPQPNKVQSQYTSNHTRSSATLIDAAPAPHGAAPIKEVCLMMTKEEFERLSDEEMNAALIDLLFQLGLVLEEEVLHVQTA